MKAITTKVTPVIEMDLVYYHDNSFLENHTIPESAESALQQEVN